MKKKKMNSYVKLIVTMIIGGFIGAIIGFADFFFGNGLKDILSKFAFLLETNAHIILWFLVFLSLLVNTFCYCKSGSILKQSLTVNDDDTQDFLDKKYDLWGTFGIATSNIILVISFVVLAFSCSNIMSISLRHAAQLLVSFLLCMIICIVYQIAIVKQMKKKDPTKYDDAMSMRFQEKFIETCDEGERQLIYKSAYKTFVFMQQITVYILCIAILGHLMLGTGMAAVILIGILYITMTTAYSIYSIKLQQTKV